MRRSLIVFVVCVLAACGGGAGDPESTPTTAADQTTEPAEATTTTTEPEPTTTTEPVPADGEMLGTVSLQSSYTEYAWITAGGVIARSPSTGSDVVTTVTPDGQSHECEPPLLETDDVSTSDYARSWSAMAVDGKPYLLVAGSVRTQGDGIEPGSAAAWIKAVDPVACEVVWTTETASTDAFDQPAFEPWVFGVTQDVLIAADDVRVIGLDPGTGEELWSTDVVAEREVGDRPVLVLLRDQVAVDLDGGTGDDNRVRFIDVGTGETVGEQPMRPWDLRYDAVAGNAIASAAADGMLLTTAENSRVLPMAGPPTLIVADPAEEVFVTQYQDDGAGYMAGILAFDAASGEQVWAWGPEELATSRASLVGAPAPSGLVYVTSQASGQLAVIDSMTGEQVVGGDWEKVVNVGSAGESYTGLVDLIDYFPDADADLWWAHGFVVSTDTNRDGYVSRSDDPPVGSEDGVLVYP